MATTKAPEPLPIYESVVRDLMLPVLHMPVTPPLALHGYKKRKTLARNASLVLREAGFTPTPKSKDE